MKIEHSFFDYLLKLCQNKKRVIINFFTVCFITALVSLSIPKVYKSQATLLPPTDDDGFNFGSILDNLPIAGLGIGGGAIGDGTSMVVAIVNSRVLRENVIEKFDLVNRYKAENIEEAVLALKKNISIDLSDEGMIKISARAKTPYFSKKDDELEARQTCQKMVNYIIAQVDSLNRHLKNEKASFTRMFIEKRYMQNIQDLTNAEENLKDFQTQTGVLVLPEQLQESISAIAEIKAQMSLKEIELEYHKQMMDESHPNVVRIQQELTAMQREYDNLASGSESANVIIPLEKAPELGVKYARLFREVRLQETIMEFLLPQYEQAKIQEAKDTSTLQILDPASFPIKRISPKRSFMVVFAGFMTLLIFFFVAYIQVNFESLKENNKEKYDTLNKLTQELHPKSFFKKDGR